MFHLNLPSNLCQTSSSTTPVSSPSSLNFTSFELSRVSHLTDSSYLETPFGSFDPIFGGDPQFPHADSEWKLDVENAIKETEMRVLEGFDKAFLQGDTCDDLYDQTDDEFDAVAAVRATLKRNPPTITTQRALEIIEKRSTSARDGLASKVVVVDVAEEIEEYAGDFKFGDEEQIEISMTPRKSDNSPLRTVHAGLATPVIQPIDANWGCPSFATYDISVSAAASVSQSMVSPLLLDNPIFSSPLLLQEPIFGSPIVSVSSVMFRSRQALPNSPLAESLDFAGVIQLEIAANPRPYDVIRNTNSDRWGQQVGLGLVGISTPKAKGVGTPTETGQGSSPGSMKHESGSVKSPEVRLHVDFREPGVCRRYIPRAPPNTLVYTGLGGKSINTVAATVTAGSDHPAASDEYVDPVAGSSEKRKGSRKVTGLGLGLPSSLKSSQARHTSCLPRSEGCQDLTMVTISPEMDESVRVFRRRRLSPIPEEDWAQLLRSPLITNHERQKKRGLKPRGFVKRALKFLF